VTLAGYNDVTGSDALEYESSEVDEVDGEPRSTEEITAAESVAEVEPNEGATTLEALSFESHEFVLEGDFRRSTVQGTVENIGENRIQLGRYINVGGDLDRGVRWSFQVILLELPDDIADYDVAVVGTPA
jgi:hypothetical protein